MSEDLKTLRAFLRETRVKADVILGADHVSADVKTIIKDLIHAGQNLDILIDLNSGQSADGRVLKKKLEAAKSEIRSMEAKVEGAKKLIMALVEEIRILTVESANISKRHTADPNDPDSLSAARIKASLQKVAEIIVKSQQQQP